MLIFKERIKKLVEGFFWSRNVEIRRIHDDLWEVFLPEDLMADLGSDSKDLQLTFSPRLPGAGPHSILMTAGAPFIFRIMEIIGTEGLQGEGYLAVESELINSRRGIIPQSIQFVNCSGVIDSTGVEYPGLGLFIYRLGISGRERREEIVPVFFDLAGNGPVEGFTVDQVLGKPLLDEPPCHGLILDNYPLPRGEAEARRVLFQNTRQVLSVLDEEGSRLLKQEKKRIDDYMDLQREKAKSDLEKKDIDKAREQMHQEIQGRYAVGAEARLAMALLIRYPVIRYRIRLVRGSDSAYFEMTRDLLRNSIPPVVCPRCGREAEKMGLCEEHGAVCADEIWTCPVCRQDRCGSCDYIECCVDGVRKDPDCTFSCQFCLSRAGLDKKVQCRKCRQEGCSQCLQTCSDCGELICPDCGSICSSCGNTFCRDKLDDCAMCPGHVCKNCGIRECDSCGKKSCHQHSFFCSRCQGVFCNDCMGGQDASSGGILCRDCLHTCPGCGKTVNPDTAGKCATCGLDICGACGGTCHICNTRQCPAHTSRCLPCDRELCPEHSGFCYGCGDTLCQRHLSPCPVCGVLYCNACRPSKKPGEICSFCSEPSPVKNARERKALEVMLKEKPQLLGVSAWEYSRSKEIFIFYGRDLLTEHTLAVKIDSGQVINHVRRGLMDRIAGFFNKNKGPR